MTTNTNNPDTLQQVLLIANIPAVHDALKNSVYTLNKAVSSKIDTIPVVGQGIVNLQMEDCTHGLSQWNTRGCQAIRDVIAARK